MSFERRRKRAGQPLDLRGVLASRTGRAVLLTTLMFAAGYTISAGWLFPSDGDPVDAEVTEVPDLTGTPVAEARARLVELGFVAEEGPRLAHPDVPSDAVVAQSPLPGQVARSGDTVRLALSSGPETRTVPEMTGLAADEAATILRRLGFDVRIERSSAPARAGVIETRPEPGTRVALPAEVEIVVSEGASIVTVPDLRGRHVDDIQTILTAVDLRMGAIRYQVEGPEGPGRVVSQSPAPGTSLRSEGLVSIVVAGAPPDSVDADMTDEAPPPRPDSTAASGGL